MKRILLFVVTNVAVMLVLSVVAALLGLTPNTGDWAMLMAFCAVFGFGGSFISLLLSKSLAKWTTGARVITGSEGPEEAWLVGVVADLAHRAGIGMPDVAIYRGAPNAFATGAFRNSALVAVSTGLLETMDADELEAVLAHEVAHIANGDMQTMGLLQGVVNTFVMFAARVVGAVVDKAVFRSEEGRGPGYFLVVWVLELVFGILASLIVMAFSRYREYRADYGAATLLGSAKPMQRALARLGGMEPGELPKSLAAFGINGSGLMALFSSHPPIRERILALQKFGR